MGLLKENISFLMSFAMLQKLKELEWSVWKKN